jgi:hypothetical protein
MAYSHIYYKRNKQTIDKANRKWAINNRRKTRGYLNKHRENQRNQVLKYLGNKCKQCGFSDKRALQIDHVQGNGAKERKALWLYEIHKRILSGQYDNDYQLLCANCNQIKKAINKEQVQRIDS